MSAPLEETERKELERLRALVPRLTKELLLDGKYPTEIQALNVCSLRYAGRVYHLLPNDSLQVHASLDN